MSLEDLLKFAKVEKHTTTPEEIADLLGVADRCMADASQKVISTELRFIAAYQAALAAGEALMHCYSIKAPKHNHHFMVWESLRYILDASFNDALALFNDARSKRGEAFYDRATVTSQTELDELLKETKKFVEYVKARIRKDFSALAKRLASESGPQSTDHGPRRTLGRRT